MRSRSLEDSRYVVALDVGGTSAKAGVVRLSDRMVSGRDRVPLRNSDPADRILGDLAGCVASRAAAVPADGAVTGLALAFPGPFEYDTGVCRIAGVAKFESLFGMNIGDELAARTGIPRGRIAFVNDAEAALGGEIRHGAARGRRRVVGVTLGTGMGSGFFVDAARVSDGPGVPDNGGWLFDSLHDGMMADDCFSIRGLKARLRRFGAPSDDPENAAAAARTGDPSSLAAFTDFGRGLGKFLAPFARAFGADAILCVGGLCGAFDLFETPLRAAAPVAVVTGTLGMDAPLIAAADRFLARAENVAAV